MAENVFNKATKISECPKHGGMHVEGCHDCWKALKQACEASYEEASKRESDIEGFECDD